VLLLHAGADKVAINSAASRETWLKMNEAAAARFGSQCVVVSIERQTIRRRPIPVLQSFGDVDTGRDPVNLGARARGPGGRR